MPDTYQTAQLSVRLLTTTDLHMNLLGHDYFHNRESVNSGLTRLAPLIRRMRFEARNCLLFDNGDFLQGTPCGDYLGECWLNAKPRGNVAIHPLVQCFNLLKYDAATIGNHDFAFGQDFLLSALSKAEFPIVSSNLDMGANTNILRRTILLREFADDEGTLVSLKIGLLGFLPPQTIDWNSELRGQIEIEDILDAARREIALLRDEGADLVIALAHSGIGPVTHLSRMENAATALASLPGIDVIVAGHIHRVFPSPDFPAGPGIDPIAGTLCGKPAVMAGFWGSHLGVIDLSLEQSAEGWRIARHQVRALPVDPSLPADPVMTARLAPLHQSTLTHLDREIARTETPLNSFFALIGQDAGLNLINMAQAAHVRRLLADGPWRDLPVLSVASPSRAGGLGGPDHYTDIHPGALTLRSLADLYLFSNRLCAILITGAQLCDWLERSCSIFRQIAPEAGLQPLIDPEFPAYNFDVISDLEWQIDLSRPPRYSPCGNLISPESHRAMNIRYSGHEIDKEQQFILATNSYRLSAYGLFAPVSRGEQLILGAEVECRDVLDLHIRNNPTLALKSDLGFSLSASGARISFETSPRAIDHLSQIAHLAPSPGPLTDQGFLPLGLTL